MATSASIAVSGAADSLSSAISSAGSKLSTHEAGKQGTHLSYTCGFSCIVPGSLSSQIAKPSATKAVPLFSKSASNIASIASLLRAAEKKAAAGIK
ncbi:MAG: hypothetical protein FWD65_00805 [Coriobacteriia bacterium]|nr:hypothetical protein [Coriobacteriia bacterium]